MSKKVPDGWFEYDSFKDPIKDTRILPVKTPLKERFNTGLSRDKMRQKGLENGVPLEEEFTPAQFLKMLRSRGLKLGLIIDLTNTSRYYDGKTFEDAGVCYYKIKCPGQEIPPNYVYKDFSEKLSSFLSNPNYSEDLVAVHCTHGLNRTGYLVCRYLVESCSVDVETAIKRFGDARGYPIKRENYLDHLRKGCPSSGRSKSSPSSGASVSHSHSSKSHKPKPNKDGRDDRYREDRDQHQDTRSYHDRYHPRTDRHYQDLSEYHRYQPRTDRRYQDSSEYHRYQPRTDRCYQDSSEYYNSYHGYQYGRHGYSSGKKECYTQSKRRDISEPQSGRDISGSRRGQYRSRRGRSEGRHSKSGCGRGKSGDEHGTSRGYSDSRSAQGYSWCPPPQTHRQSSYYPQRGSHHYDDRRLPMSDYHHGRHQREEEKEKVHEDDLYYY